MVSQAEGARKSQGPTAQQVTETLMETLLALTQHKKEVFVDNLITDYPVLTRPEAEMAALIWRHWLMTFIGSMLAKEEV
jgi:hypothetical protein